MLRRACLVLLLPLGALAAQSNRTTVIITAPANGAIRLSGPFADSSFMPTTARGRMQLTIVGIGPLQFRAAADSGLSLHAEVTNGNNSFATGDGNRLTIQRDSGSVSVTAASSAPQARPREP